MKKVIVTLALAMLVLSGCSGKKAEQAPTTATQAPTEAAPVQIVPSTRPTESATQATTAPTVPPTTETATVPTTVPTVPPAAAIVITKHPSSERVSAGGRTWFIADAENATQITWEIFSPDGTMYSLQQAMSANPGLVLEALPEDTLGLRQIPASFSGWSARARYDGPGGTATTERAVITVSDPFSEVIETYRAVHRSGTGNIEKGISELVNPYDFLGYTMMDVDGNGVQDLVLASDGYNMYPYVIYEVYTLENGKAVSLLRSAARSRYFMLSDGRFLMEGSNSAVSSVWITYRFTSDNAPAMVEEIWTSDVPHYLSDFAPYYYYSRPYGSEEPLDYDEAVRTIARWEMEIIAPSLTPIN